MKLGDESELWTDDGTQKAVDELNLNSIYA